MGAAAARRRGEGPPQFRRPRGHELARAEAVARRNARAIGLAMATAASQGVVSQLKRAIDGVAQRCNVHDAQLAALGVPALGGGRTQNFLSFDR